MPIRIEITADTAAEARNEMLAFLGNLQVVVQERDLQRPSGGAVTGSPPPLVQPPKARAQRAEKAMETPATDTSQPPSDTSAKETTSDPGGSATTASPSEQGPLDYNTHIKPAVLKVSAKYDRSAVEKLMADFDVDHFTKLAPERYPELLMEIDKLLGAE